MKMYETTEKDFELFVSKCEELVKLVGLTDWEIFYSHKLVDGRAQSSSDTDGMIANLILSTEWNNKPTDELVMKSAAHEVLEVLLLKLRYLALEDMDIDLKIKLMDSETHAIIRRLEKILSPVNLPSMIL